MIMLPEQGATTETEPFPAFDDTTFEISPTPSPSKATPCRSATNHISPSRPSPGTAHRIRDKVKAQLNERYTAEQQEAITELNFECLGEQQHNIQQSRKTTDDAMIYIEALKECLVTTSNLQRETADLHKHATESFQRASERLQAHLRSVVPSNNGSMGFPQYHVLRPHHDAFHHANSSAEIATNDQISPSLIRDHPLGIMPVRSLETVIEEGELETPESIQHSAFAHELPQHDYRPAHLL